MTTFQEHDRLRVVDASHRYFAHAVRGGTRRQLATGEIVEVMRVHGNSVQLVGFPAIWRGNRFELVEHAVNTDRDGKPLYVGDIVRRLDTASGVPGEGPVERQQPTGAYSSKVAFEARNHTGTALLTPERDQVVLVRHHWEPETAKKGVFGPEVAGHELRVGAFMVLQRKSALAWGKVDGWSVKTGAHVEVSLKDGGPAQTYNLDEWDVVLHQPAVSPDLDHWNHVFFAYDGSTSNPDVVGYEVRLDDQPVRFLPVSNHGGGRAVDIKLDPAEVAEFARVIQDYACQISRALGIPEPPAPPVWDDVEVGMSVRVRVKATNEVFVAMVTESPSHREGQPTSPHIHGLWIGIGAIKKGWELLSLSPELPTTEGSIIAPDSNPANRSRAYLIDGEWWFDPKGPKAILPMKADLDNFRDWRVIRDAGKDS